MYVLLIIEHNGNFFILFIIIITLDAPLLWSNTTCIGGFLHNLN